MKNKKLSLAGAILLTIPLVLLQMSHAERKIALLTNGLLFVVIILSIIAFFYKRSIIDPDSEEILPEWELKTVDGHISASKMFLDIYKDQYDSSSSKIKLILDRKIKRLENELKSLNALKERLIAKKQQN
ncbi:MAG: hypothetical protein ACFE9T_15280 [Promethearchaeota archaeon]